MMAEMEMMTFMVVMVVSEVCSDSDMMSERSLSAEHKVELGHDFTSENQ